MSSVPLLALLGMLACVESEGHEAGECADLLDNDKDGLYDCEDPDCAGSGDCDGGGGQYDACFGYDHQDWREEYESAVCTLLVECGYVLGSHEECVEGFHGGDTGVVFECDDFDCEAAGTCIEAIQAASCEELLGLDLFREACGDVCSNDGWE